jgi:hypothetical protein
VTAKTSTARRLITTATLLTRTRQEAYEALLTAAPMLVAEGAIEAAFERALQGTTSDAAKGGGL